MRQHRRQETGDRRQETGDRRQETGDRRQETGDRRQETVSVCPYFTLNLIGVNAADSLRTTECSWIRQNSATAE
jgi:hypothetical protein